MSPMQTHLGPAPREFHAGEFALVIALAFGLSLVASLSAALSYSGRPVEFGDPALAGTLVYEALFGAIIAAVLRARGWKGRDFAIHPSRGSTILGLALAAFVLAAWSLIEAAIGKVPVALTGTLPWILAVSIVNPLFEELLVLGYVVQSLRGRFGLVVAVNASIAIRVAYHLYEGPLAVIPIVLFAVLVTATYVKLGRLWPAIVAHAVVDFVGLSLDT